MFKAAVIVPCYREKTEHKIPKSRKAPFQKLLDIRLTSQWERVEVRECYLLAQRLATETFGRAEHFNMAQKNITRFERQRGKAKIKISDRQAEMANEKLQ